MMKKLFLLFSLVWASCTSPAQSQLSADQTEKMLKDQPTTQLVDLRTPAEQNQTGIIKGAKKIDFKAADFQAQLGQLDKEKPVLLYCAAGGRSGKTATILTNLGFKSVYEYSGGMNDWLAKKKATVKE